MGDQDGGDAGFGKNLGHGPPGGHAQAGVESGKRLIQEHQFGFAGQRAGQCHTLLLPAGELVWPAFGHGGVQGDHVQQFVDPACRRAAAARQLGCIQAERDVLANRQVREKRPILGHIPYVAFMRGHPDAVARHLGAVERDAARCRMLKTGDQA